MRKVIQTCISEGFIDLIDTFAKANNLELELKAIKTTAFRHQSIPKIEITYEDDSETGSFLSFLSLKFVNIENMLCDYLNRCGVPLEHICYGRT